MFRITYSLSDTKSFSYIKIPTKFIGFDDLKNKYNFTCETLERRGYELLIIILYIVLEFCHFLNIKNLKFVKF